MQLKAFGSAYILLPTHASLLTTSSINGKYFFGNLQLDTKLAFVYSPEAEPIHKEKAVKKGSAMPLSMSKNL